MKHISYPKTVQFRNVVTNVSSMATFAGLDENGDAIYDGTRKKPTLIFKGTVKLHGTNAGVCYNDTDGVYVQSRNNAFGLDKGESHMGFTFFVKSKEQLFLNIFNAVKDKYEIDTTTHTITVYGEWAGQGVQKTVAISELPKSFYLFGCKISKPSDPDFNAYWVDVSEYTFPETDNMWNIYEFETYEIEVDFDNPGIAQNKFVELVDKVEKECPVAKHFGVSGIGEGIVWISEYKGSRLLFKTKGEKHAGKSKVKTVKPVDEGKLKLVSEIADKVTPTWRLNQMFNEVTRNGEDISRKHIGTYIKMVIKDVLDEDIDIIVDAGLNIKDISGKISGIAKDYFFEQETL